MKLDRDFNADGRGKYGLVLNRKLTAAKYVHSPQGLTEIEHAIQVLETAGIIDWGNTADTEFFVIRLKDTHAERALHAYAYGARTSDLEYADAVSNLAYRAAQHPNRKEPD